MRRALLAALAALMLAPATASAGDVCVNGTCAGAPQVSAKVWADIESRIAFTAGTAAGPRIDTTGLVNIEAQPGDVGVTPTVNGWSWGRTGVSHEDGNARLCLSQVGCQHVGDDPRDDG